MSRSSALASWLRTAVAALGGAALLAGCGSTPPPPSPAVAKVGGDVITQATFDLRLNATLASLQQDHSTDHASAQYRSMVAGVRASVMRSLILDAVIAQEAQLRGVAVADADVDREVSAEVAAAGGQSTFDDEMAAGGHTLAELRDSIRASLNESRLENLFAQQRAAAIAQQLDGGADFASVARQLSDDTDTASKGGDMGVLGDAELAKDSPAFADAVRRLQPGQHTTAPVRDDAGYELIAVDAVAAAGRSVRHILVVAPRVYRVQDRPQWFTESIVDALRRDCEAGRIVVYVDKQDQPCSGATPSPGAGSSPAGGAGSSPAAGAGSPPADGGPSPAGTPSGGTASPSPGG